MTGIGLHVALHPSTDSEHHGWVATGWLGSRADKRDWAYACPILQDAE